MTKFHMEIDEETLRGLVLEHIQSQLGLAVDVTEKDITIEVKSKQNYRSEWEPAAYRAVVKRTA